MSKDIAKPSNIKSSYPDSHFPNASLAVDFLMTIAGRGLMTVATISPLNVVRSSTYDLAKPTDIENMRSFIAFSETAPANVYYVANRAFAGAKFVLPGREDIDQIRTVVLDFDPARDHDLGEERDRLRGVAWNLINGPLPPGAIVDTGGGMQVVYQLAEPIDITDLNRAAVTDDIESLMKSLARSHGADTKTCTIKNLFRVPGTFNWPTAAKKAAGRERSVSGIWFTGGPRTTLENLRALCTIRPEDIAARPVEVDFDGVDEHAVIAVLGQPELLPDRIKRFIDDRPALRDTLLRPADPSDTSNRDHHMANKMAVWRMPPGDMLLALSAYGAKVHKAFKEERLFSWCVREVRKALANNAPENFFEDLADAAEEEDIRKRHQAKLARLQPRSMPVFLDRLFEDIDVSLIQGCMRRRETTVVYGQSGSGKTFAILDLAWRVSLGLPWGDRKTIKAAVIYVAAESPRSIRFRMRALVDRHGPSDSFFCVPGAPNMFDSRDDMKTLVDGIAALGVDVGMIVFDTLARVNIGGNENSTEDMSQLVTNGDRLRDRFDCNVVWIHHTGKDDARGARGSSALRAATDTEIEIRDGTTLRITKMRDGDPFDCLFHLRKVKVGQMADGSEAGTCVVDWHAVSTSSGTPRDRNRETIIRALRMLGEPSSVPDILARIELEGLKLTIRKRAVLQMLVASCRSETERFFTRHEEKIGKKLEVRYGLCEWERLSES